MTTDLERLARVNPAPYEADPAADDALLRRVLMEAAPPTGDVAPAPRRHARARVFVALAVAVVALGLVALGPGDGTDPVRHLAGAERAYAAVVPGGDVIHEVVTSTWSAPGKPGGSERYEGWYRPSTGQAVRITSGDEGTTRVMVTRDGTVLVESSDTRLLTGKPGLMKLTSPAIDAFRTRNRRDFAAAFRAAYTRGRLTDRGMASFDGRPAHRFATRDGLDFYTDPRSGRPLGSVERIGRQVNIRRLAMWERLEPDPATLAHLDIR